MKEVDPDKAVLANEQLHYPYVRPENRKEFFDILERGGSFEEGVRKCLARAWWKQRLKAVILRLHLLKGGVRVIDFSITIEEGQKSQ